MAAEEQRQEAGWAPFWRYRGLGRYGEQLTHLHRHVDPAQVLTLRYRELVERPQETVHRVLGFLGVAAHDGAVRSVPRDNSRPFRPDTPRTRTLARLVGAGAALGAHLPPQVWRTVSRPLLAELHRGGVHRPELTPAQRRQVLEPLLPDIDLLEQVTGQSFDDWRAEVGRGAFAARVPAQVTAELATQGPTSSVTRS